MALAADDGLQIRSAVPADADACLRLLGLLGGPTGRAVPASARDAFLTLTEGARGQVLVADRAGDVVGMAAQSYNLAMRYGGAYAQLEELVVDPSARGLNLGARLMEAAIACARAAGAAEYGLYLVAHTEGNRPFYEKFGLKTVGSEMRMPL